MNNSIDERATSESEAPARSLCSDYPVVVVTGASSGIGKAVVEKFHEFTCRIHGIDCKDSAFALHDDFYIHHKCDIRGELPDIENVSILVNCAGVENSGCDIDTNLKGLIACTEKYGVQSNIMSIVNLAAAAASTGADFPEYVASKGGVVAYTKNVAKRVAPYGATCNSVSFGGVVTDLNSVVLNDAKLWRKVMDMTPLKRWTTVEECAEWIFFLAVKNKSMTGQDLVIDNGEMYNHTFVWRE